MKQCIFIWLILLAVTSFCAPNISKQSKHVSAGLLERPGSSRGKILFVNTQTCLNPTNIYTAIGNLKEHLSRYTFEVVCSSNKDPVKLKAEYNANVVVVIIDDEKVPSLLSAPDESWAIVNIGKLKEALQNEFAIKKFFDSRCRKQIMRGFACAAGGVGSTFPGNIMNVSNIRDLDLCEEFVPFDKIAIFKRHLSSVGVLPSKYVSYRKACQEGWAPAPTNDVQRAIWERVKADKERGPTNPIEIPMPKKK